MSFKNIRTVTLSLEPYLRELDELTIELDLKPHVWSHTMLVSWIMDKILGLPVVSYPHYRFAYGKGITDILVKKGLDLDLYGVYETIKGLMYSNGYSRFQLRVLDIRRCITRIDFI